LDSLHHKIDGEKRRAQILESKKPLFTRRLREIKKPVPRKPDEVSVNDRTRLHWMNNLKNILLLLTQKFLNHEFQEPSKKLSDFLQTTGGTTGSWKAHDHQAFLRAYKKFKSQPDLMIENILKDIPG